MNTSQTVHNTSASPRNSRKWWALAAITLAVMAVGIDQTVLSIALPTLAGALHASTAQLQWFVASFSLALCATLLPAGLLGDRFGRKRFLLIALVIFGAGSLLCAYSTSAGMLIASRVLLGIGAAFLIPLSMAVLPVLFGEKERTRAVGIWAAANFLSLPIGPILGGWLLTRFWWGSVFLINVPVVVLALAAAAFLLPESRSDTRQSLDPAGILLSSGGLVGLVYGVIQAGVDGWGGAQALVPLAAGAACLVLFVLWERALGKGVAHAAGRHRGPLVDLGLFRSAAFTWGTILSALGIFAMSGMLFGLPQYFQAILGADAMGAGLRLLPVIGGLLVGALASSRVTALAGARVTAAFGFVLMGAGLLTGTATTPETGFGFVAAWAAASGAGLGLSLAAAAGGAVGALPSDRSGVGSAVLQAVQKVGIPFGAAILGSVYNSLYKGRLDVAGLPASAAEAVKKSVFAGVATARQLHSAGLLESVRSAFVHGMNGMLWVCAGAAAAGAVLALLFLPRRSSTVVPEPAERIG